METTVGSVLFLVVALMLGLGVFAVYSTVFVPQYNKVSLNEQAITISKTTSIYVSSLTSCKGAVNETITIPLVAQGDTHDHDKKQQTLKTWILDYGHATTTLVNLITVDSPLTQVVLVPFVTKPTPEPFYASPGPSQNAEIVKLASNNSFVPVPNITISNQIINIPQYGSIGPINATGYKVYTNTSYVLVANASPSSVVIIWVLANLNGQWYRVGYAYIKPSGEGVGMYVASLTGLYNLSTESLSNPTPHIVISNKGTQMGLWFMPIMYYSKPSVVINVTIAPTGTTSEEKGVNPNYQKRAFNIIFYTVNSSLYFNVTNGANPNSIYSHGLVYSKLQVGQWYFLNFTLGAINSPDHDDSGTNAKTMIVTIYNLSAYKLSTAIGQIPPQSEVNGNKKEGYTLMIRLGDKYAVNVISQFFGETLHDKSNSEGKPSLAYFYAVSSMILDYGPLANYTHALGYIMNISDHSMDGLYYVFAANPCYLPSSSPNMTLWYYPQGGGIGSYKYPVSIPIPGIGSYSYVII